MIGLAIIAAWIGFGLCGIPFLAADWNKSFGRMDGFAPVFFMVELGPFCFSAGLVIWVCAGCPPFPDCGRR